MASYRTEGFAPREWLADWARGALIRLFHFFDQHPFALRVLHTLLRPRPVWRIGHSVLITGDRQARDVLNRDDDFPLPEKRATKFLHGPFILGMTRTPQFEAERKELAAALPKSDESWVQLLCDAVSLDAVQKVGARGHLDVVGDLSTPVGKELIRAYFGVNEYAAGRTPELIEDLRKLGAMVASPDAERPEFQDAAGCAAVRVSVHVEQEIENTVQGLAGVQTLTARETVLRRLVFNQSHRLNRDAVRRSIIGVLLPGTALVNRAFATSLVQLLKHKSL